VSGPATFGFGVQIQGSWVQRCNPPKALSYGLADRPKALGSSVRARSSWVRRCSQVQGSWVCSLRGTQSF